MIDELEAGLASDPEADTSPVFDYALLVLDSFKVQLSADKPLLSKKAEQMTPKLMAIVDACELADGAPASIIRIYVARRDILSILSNS